jgi:hypothetical protein
MKKKHYKLEITVSKELSNWSNGKERLSIGCFNLKEDGYYFGRCKSWCPDDEELAFLKLNTSNN